MTKKIMSQNGVDKVENSEKQATNTASTENSENSNKLKRKIINKIKNDYIFVTPAKKVKLFPYIPSTPKKKKKTFQCEDFHIVGKNLTNIFESM